MPDGKQPFYITGKDDPVLSFAGLWDEWKDPVTGKPIKSATIIVTAANKLAAQIHDRMPVLLAPKQFDAWLSGTAGSDILESAPEKMLWMSRCHGVNKAATTMMAALIEAVKLV